MCFDATYINERRNTALGILTTQGSTILAISNGFHYKTLQCNILQR